MTEAPKVFISYSWTSPDHEDWVINLAERLVSNGIDVVIDKWELKEGQDMNNFMESMVKSPEIEKVLIILDKKYAEKADQRSGGVGSETQIISPQIFANVSQEKFIPLITEKDEEGNVFVPVFLKGRIYIDFSSQEKYEESYENLLRNLLKRPKFSKPKLGKVPSYIVEETPISHKTSSILRNFDNQISKNEKRVNSLLHDFLDEFFINLKDFTITFSVHDHVIIGKEICENIKLYTPLRNDFISFFDKLIKGEYDFDIDIIIKFLEKLSILKYPQQAKSSWSEYEFDNFRFIIHELFLYLIVIGLKNGSYKFLQELFYSSYFFDNTYQRKSEPNSFNGFYNHIESIKPYYDKTYSNNFFSPMADLIIKRIPEPFSSDLVIEADLLCHYVGVLNHVYWFPITYIYKSRGSFEFFDRLVSSRHFEKTKILFNSQNVDELKEKLSDIQKNDKYPGSVRYVNSFNSVIPVYKIIDIEKISTTR